MKKGMKIVAESMVLITGIAGLFKYKKIKDKDISGERVRVDKFKNYYYLLNQWLINKNKGKSLEDYFVEKNYKKIAVYGMGEIGKRFFDELNGSENVKVCYAIDQSGQGSYEGIEVYDLEEDTLPEVDAVVITATFALEEARENIEGKMDCPVVSIDDIVFDL